MASRGGRWQRESGAPLTGRSGYTRLRWAFKWPTLQLRSPLSSKSRWRWLGLFTSSVTGSASMAAALGAGTRLRSEMPDRRRRCRPQDARLQLGCLGRAPPASRAFYRSPASRRRRPSPLWLPPIGGRGGPCPNVAQSESGSVSGGGRSTWARLMQPDAVASLRVAAEARRRWGPGPRKWDGSLARVAEAPAGRSPRPAPALAASANGFLTKRHHALCGPGGETRVVSRPPGGTPGPAAPHLGPHLGSERCCAGGPPGSARRGRGRAPGAHGGVRPAAADSAVAWDL